MLEAYEATRNLDIVDKPIETPVAPMVGKHIASPAPIIVPVLRAGLGMLDGMTKMIPTAEVGFLGMKRDEEHPTQQITYANRLPEDLTGRQCFLIDPMLATGGTLVTATHYLAERGAKDVTAINIIAAYETIKFGNGDGAAAAERAARYERADLLIIDDMGTEMGTAFTVSALYNLINNRLMAHRPMIVNTNLLPDELKKRYSPAVASRLLGEFKQLRFFGDDIRMLKSRMQNR